uniref:Uncharacterized protein n=1 Tax=Parascaris univalens TaxID=6257 RepID=A0A915C078_PARUN
MNEEVLSEIQKLPPIASGVLYRNAQLLIRIRWPHNYPRYAFHAHRSVEFSSLHFYPNRSTQ